MKYFAILILSTFIICCAHSSIEPMEKSVPASSRPDLAKFVVKADEVAEEVLKDFNNSDWAEELGEGTFKLADYDRWVRVKIDEFNKRKVVVVAYILRKPVIFLGHPEHFWVHVFIDTGETDLIPGM